MQIKVLLEQAMEQLHQVPNPKLDAELLLSYSLQQPRSYLIAHGDDDLAFERVNTFLYLLRRRLKGEPLAYITGRKEFWSLDFKVNKQVLIPRPETELLVELILREYSAEQPLRLLDLGTGCGSIALALAHDRPNWQITAVDSSEAALAVARENARRFNIANVRTAATDWFQGLLPAKFDVIVSNPPYIATDDPYVDGIDFEPPTALFAGQDGLQDLQIIIAEAGEFLQPGGWLLLEHGFEQRQAVAKLLELHKYQEVVCHKDLAGHDRVTTAHCCC